MILNKSDTCRFCGGMKMVHWQLVDYRQAPWSEWRDPADQPANNEMQQAVPIEVACIECGLVYHHQSLATPIVEV